MKALPKKSLLALAVSLGLTFVVGSALAEDKCGGKGEPECPPPKVEYCHNIGGPRDLGANCDGTGTCTFEDESGLQIRVKLGNFLGILIPPTSLPNKNALAAHIAHGDGPVLATFDPPLHLASVIGPHRASNVECLGRRVLAQPPEPGN